MRDVFESTPQKEFWPLTAYYPDLSSNSILCAMQNSIVILMIHIGTILSCYCILKQKLNQSYLSTENIISETKLFVSLFLGGCCGSRAKKTRVGGWAWAWWLVTDVQRLSLEVKSIV